MAKKIYNKNAREAHLLAEAYQRVYNEDAEDTGIESVFKQMQRAIMNGMTGKESMESLGVHPSHQRDLLAKYLEWSEEWSEGPIETGFEDAEGDWVKNTAAGREDGNEPDNRNKGDTPWYDEKEAEDVDHISEAIKEMIKTFLDDDKFEGGLQDAFDLTIEQIGDSLGYYTIDNIGYKGKH